MTWTVRQGDCRVLLAALEPDSIDACVTDPPYGIGFMGRGWDSPDNVAFRPETWQLVLRVLKPGAHLLAFGGTRMFHRLTCAIEDAGFEVRDVLCWLYGQGFPKSHDVSKAIDKAAGAEREVVGGKPGKLFDPHVASALLARASGAEHVSGTVPITAPATPDAKQWDGWGTALAPSWEPVILARKPLSQPAVDIVEAVEYHLKQNGFNEEIRWIRPAKAAERQSNQGNSIPTRPPATAATSVAPASVSGMLATGQTTESNAAKPGAGTTSKTETKSSRPDAPAKEGSGSLSSRTTAGSAPAAERPRQSSSPLTTSMAGAQQVDEPGLAKKSPARLSVKDSRLDFEFSAGTATRPSVSMGDVLVTVSYAGERHAIRRARGGLVWPQALPKRLPARSLTVAANVLQHGTGGLNIDGCRLAGGKRVPGSLAKKEQRFGFGASHGKSLSQSGHDPTIGRWPPNVALDEEAAAAVDRQSGTLTSGGGDKRGGCKFFMGGDKRTVPTGHRVDTGGASRFFYCPKASTAERNAGLGDEQNTWPTVKPIALMRWLCRLVTPPGGLVLDPFCGSGSTGVAAALEGFRFLGLDQDAEAVRLARLRIHHRRPDDDEPPPPPAAKQGRLF